MDEEYFWSQLEAEYGSINLHIRNILKRQNLCSQSLAKLTIETIRGIETDMQIMADGLKEEAAAGGTPLLEMYGRTYANLPETFRFMNGEVMCLLDLAEVMKRKGIKHFIKKKRSSTVAAVSIQLDERDADEYSRRLCEKIMLHFASQGIEDPSYDELLEKLKNIKVKIFTDGTGKFRAEALCPICETDGKRAKVSFVMDDRGNWHIYSLTRHSNTVHYEIPESSLRKRRRAINKTGDADRLLDTTSEQFIDFEENSHEDSLETPNTSVSTDRNHSDSIVPDPLSITENELLDISREHSDTMEEERLDDEQNGNFNTNEADPDTPDGTELEHSEEITDDSIGVAENHYSFVGESNKMNKVTPLLDVQININRRFQLQGKYGVRYTEYELDTAAYLLLSSGISAYKFKRANMRLPSLKAAQRHISRHTNDTQEGVLMIDPLIKYLTANNFPNVVALSEDGTAVSPNPEYSPRTGSVRGLVAPFDRQGMPIRNFFKASSAEKMIDDLEKYPVGEYLYVVMATPMVVGASPFCVLYMCSDNKFTHVQIKQRWKQVEEKLKEAGVKVVAHASDGDSRLLRAMKERTSLPHPVASRLYGPFFIANIDDDVVCIQDTIHLVNKLRHSLLDPKKEMLLGNFVVTSDEIRQMIEHGDKVVHKMNPSDLNPADKMKFDPALKLMSPDLIEHLLEIVPGSIGTAVYLKLMRLIYDSFVKEDMLPTERIQKIWTALFFLRAWRWQCLESSKSIKQCTTSNVYWCLELNAHAIVHFLVNCRKSNTREQFVVQNLSSQPCETTFRELRSMTTVNHTAVNFTMKDVEQRMQRVQMKLLISHRRNNILTFPCLRKQAAKALAAPIYDLLDDDQIEKAIKMAEQYATELLISVGFVQEKINFTNSVILRNSNIPQQLEFVDVNNIIHQESTEAACCEQPDLCHTSEEVVIECAERIFAKARGEVILKNCKTASKKHIFKIRRITGRVVNIKKSRMLWLLSSGRFKRSSDRLRRFHRIRTVPNARNS